MNPTLEKTKTGTARLLNVIHADAATTQEDGTQVPLQLVPSGAWVDSWKGNIEISPTDLQQMKINFDAGVALPGGGAAGAPIDYSHNDFDKAAGWITAVEVIDGILCATEYEWTPEAKQSILDGEFKFFSPSFVPACLGYYFDPEDPTISTQNVLLGGGLTNIPFFKGLTGLKASNTREGNDGKIYINASQGERMSEEVTAILAKDPSTITDDERKVLADNRSQLKADDIVKFDVDKKPVATPEKPVAPVEASLTDEQKEAIKIQASIKAGTHQLVATSEFESLKASVKTLEDERSAANKTRVESVVADAIKAGRIKQADAEGWTNLIIADASKQELLEHLPASPLIAKENGKDGASNVDASVDFDAKVRATVEASNGTLTYGQAVIQLANEDPEVANAHEAATINQ